ncbi:MAG: ribbon-helix-helix protein, CopG family [Syntrophomonadaceae bacterium]|nr:ribbon-helix-helix protein, CopG family [Syntrophomonadaceae bacterium]
MPASRKIVVNVSEKMLAEIDQIGGITSRNRSEVVRDAIRLYLKEQRKRDLYEQMRKGYVEMGDINRRIAEECFYGDHEALQSGLEKLAE